MSKNTTNVGDLDDLIRYPILSELGLDFLKTITKAHVYNNGDSAVVVDKEDRVYNIVASGEDDEVRMVLNTVLSGQKITSFSTSGHKFAVSESGVLYGWGSNMNGQLGQSTDVDDLPHDMPVIVQLMEGQKVTKVVCGNRHTVALTDDGKVWTWGGNDSSQCARTKSSSARTPQSLKHEGCCDIATGDNTSAALMTDGSLYIWGLNIYGNVGCHKSGGTRSVPYHVKLPLRAVKVTMGSDHVLTLTEDGQIFAWGRNDCGQLGINMSGTNTDSPALIECTEGKVHIRFVDIAAERRCSIALSTTGHIYMWGRFDEDTSHFAPQRVEIKTMNAVLWKHTKIGTYETLTIQYEDVGQDTARAFDNEELSDCTFTVDRKTIYAQRSTLKNRSQYFKTMFAADWKESKGTINITNHSYPVYKALIKYLHTGKLDLEGENLLDLLQLAHETLHDKLLTMCVEKHRFDLSSETILDTFEFAEKLVIDPLLGYCKQFGRIYMKDIVKVEKKRCKLLRKFLVFVFRDSHEEEEAEEEDETDADSVAD